MKKHFNIKKISMILFAFICMFLLTNNVKADDKYVCRYDIYFTNSNATDYPEDWISTDDLLFSLEYDNGTYDVKLVKKSDPSIVMNNDELFAATNNLFLNKNLTIENLKTWDFATKKSCPTQLWELWENGKTEDYFGENISGVFQLSYSISEPNVNVNGENDEYFDKCTSDAAYQRYNEYPCHSVPLNHATVDNNEPGSEDSENSVVKTCVYAYANGAEDAADYVDSIKLSYNDTYIYAERVDGQHENQNYSTTNIDLKKLGECPKILYEIDNETTLTNDLYVERPNGNNVGIYYLKTSYTVTDVTTDENELPGCDALGPTKKYIVGIINLIRFLVPVIIIALSIIDFVGVIISGETDKMEKAKKRFIIRLLIGVLILFIPFILELLLRISGILSENQSISDIVCNIIA